MTAILSKSGPCRFDEQSHRHRRDSANRFTPTIEIGIFLPEKPLGLSFDQNWVAIGSET